MPAAPLTRDPLIAGMEEIRGSWGWLLAAGIAFPLFGTVCIVGDVTATFVTVLAFGWLLLLSGVAALVHAFRIRTWSGTFLYLLSALLVDGASLVGFATAIHGLPALPVYRAA